MSRFMWIPVVNYVFRKFRRASENWDASRELRRFDGGGWEVLCGGREGKWIFARGRKFWKIVIVELR